MVTLVRQAVVVVHGMGEQAPLATLRSFVGAGLDPPDPARRPGVLRPDTPTFSDPAPVRHRPGDRIFVAKWAHTRSPAVALARQEYDDDARLDLQSMTDFYELYWAPQLRDSSVGQLLGWMAGIVRRKRSQFSSPRIVGPATWWRGAPWVLLLAAVLLVAAAFLQEQHAVGYGAPAAGLSLLAVLVASFHGIYTVVRVSVALLALIALTLAAAVRWGDLGEAGWWLALTAVAPTFGAFAGRKAALVMGDVSRFLANTAATVDDADKIRDQALDLLDRLHEAVDETTGRPRYDRIVLVGHSLGSVVAYEALTLLWARRARTLSLPSPAPGSTAAAPDHPAARALGRVEELGTAAWSSAADGRFDTDGYRDAQSGVFAALRDGPPDGRQPTPAPGTTGPRWIVSDFVTVGSPLTHADALLAVGAHQLEARFEERSLSSCPPRAQREHVVRRLTPYRQVVLAPDGHQVTSRLHQAAAFAAVRWTNMWFEHDLVGGPLAGHFGPGVRDVSLGGYRWLGMMALAFPHTSYWSYSRPRRNVAGTDRCLEELRRVIDRPPTLLLSAVQPLSAAQTAAIAEALLPAGGPTPSPRPVVEIRLYVGADGEERPAYLPVVEAPLPDPAAVRRIARQLGNGYRVTLCYGRNVLDETQVEGARLPGVPAPVLRGGEQPTEEPS